MPTFTIKGYPEVLRLFRPPDSRFWHVRLFHAGRMYKKTTKKEVRKDAERVAKQWYVEKQILLQSAGTLEATPIFDHFAQLVFAESESRIKRGERSHRLVSDAEALRRFEIADTRCTQEKWSEERACRQRIMSNGNIKTSPTPGSSSK